MEAFKMLRHQPRRYQVMLELQALAEKEFERGLKEHELVRRDAFEFLSNTANRWMY